MNYLDHYFKKTSDIRDIITQGLPLSAEHQRFIANHGLIHAEHMIHYPLERLLTLSQLNDLTDYPGIMFAFTDRMQTSIPLKNNVVKLLFKHPHLDVIDADVWNDPHSWIYDGLDDDIFYYAHTHTLCDKNGFYKPCHLLPRYHKLDPRLRLSFFHRKEDLACECVDYIFEHQQYTNILPMVLEFIINDKDAILNKLLSSHHRLSNDDLEVAIQTVFNNHPDFRLLELAKERGLMLKYIQFLAKDLPVHYPDLLTIIDIDVLSSALYMASNDQKMTDWHEKNIEVLAFYCYFNQYTCRFSNDQLFKSYVDKWKSCHDILPFAECLKLLKHADIVHEMNVIF